MVSIDFMSILDAMGDHSGHLEGHMSSSWGSRFWARHVRQVQSGLSGKLVVDHMADLDQPAGRGAA